MTIRSGSLSKGISLALFLAGPIFITSAGIGEMASHFPQAIIMPGKEVVILPMFILLAAVFGAIISLPANLIGGLAMGALSDHYHWLRPYPIWGIVGALSGLLIAITLANDSPPIPFALITTSTICASICRYWVRWDDEPAYRPDLIDCWPKLPR